MQHTQKSALTLFTKQDFEQTTVAEIAAQAEVSESTVYRHFKTKEGVILWDEHESDLDRTLGSRFKKQKPLDAIRDSFIDGIGRRYDSDDGHQLRRVQFIYQTEAIHAAAIEADFAAKGELTEALRKILRRENKAAAPLLASIALAALDTAVEEWQATNGKTRLAELLEQTFSTLMRLDQLT